LECYISPRELEEVFNQLDQDKDGTVRNNIMFHTWMDAYMDTYMDG
jgi:Ca2+-binding EF-hand superfamily protein